MLVAIAGLAKVYQVHGARDTATLRRMVEVFAALQSELESHMRKEEQILFPAIANPAVYPAGSIAAPIAVMESEHDDAGAALAELRRLTAGYQPPAYACNTVKALYSGLQALEADLHQHVHLENNILFPRAIAAGL